MAPSVSVTRFSEEGKGGELLCVVTVFKVHMLELSIINTLSSYSDLINSVTEYLIRQL